MVALELTDNSAAADRLSRLLIVAEQQGKDLKPAFMAIAGQFFREETAIFASGGSHGGRAPWPVLSDQYAAFKAKHYPGRHLMQLTGLLEDSLTRLGAKYQIFRATSDLLQIATTRMVGSATSRPYKRGRVKTEPNRVVFRSGRAGVTVKALYNLGWLHAIGAGALPKREAISVTDAQEETWADILQGHMDKV